MTDLQLPISAEAGSLPALSTLAKSLVSVTSKLPEISDLPPEIGPLDTPEQNIQCHQEQLQYYF
jgi:hypothetical protein